jgi:hypothetical protein
LKAALLEDFYLRCKVVNTKCFASDVNHRLMKPPNAVCVLKIMVDATEIEDDLVPAKLANNLNPGLRIPQISP